MTRIAPASRLALTILAGKKCSPGGGGKVGKQGQGVKEERKKLLVSKPRDPDRIRLALDTAR
jgi:hypothetical protein